MELGVGTLPYRDTINRENEGRGTWGQGDRGQGHLAQGVYTSPETDFAQQVLFKAASIDLQCDATLGEASANQHQ